ncbi:MAG: cephalosporin hydroxylase family protein [Victivallaceae bacterium]|nr:cephalosporin hydroxylase family protein [Victivallaceae bacterium]
MTKKKKLFTREEFEKFRLNSAKGMVADKKLQDDVIDVLVRADKYNWIHQATWMGEPLLNLPQDMFAIQEIIFATKPKYIIEIGVAWGGGLLFHSTLLKAWGGEKVLGIDIYMPDDLKKRIMSHGEVSEKIELINASSIEKNTVEKVEEIIGDCRDVLVILDSHHTHEHVIQELNLYSPLVGEGQYIVCGDTIVDFIPEQEHRDRPWGPGNNPMTALQQFLSENDRFEVDKEIENKLLFTCNPSGFIKCVKNY